MIRRALTAAAVFLCGLTALMQSASADVECRYIRFENVILPRMEYAEIEVMVNGKNVMRGRPDRIGGGLYGYTIYGRQNTSQQAQRLTDGGVDPDTPICDPYPREYAPYCTIDLGETMTVSSLILHSKRYDMWRKMAGKRGYSGVVDNGMRMVTTLDENGKVLTCQLIDTFAKEYADKKGVIDIPLAPQIDGIVGKTFAPSARVWMSAADQLQLLKQAEVQEFKSDPAEIEKFNHRNAPEQIEALAKEFFELIDTDRNELAYFKDLVREGKYQQALDAYKTRFITQMLHQTGLGKEIARLGKWGLIFGYTWEPVNLKNADDLLEGTRIISDATGKGIVIQKIGKDGLIPPYGFFGGATYQTNLGKNEEMLFRAYAQTGEKKYLDRWARYYDDWMLHIKQQEKDAYGDPEKEKLFMGERFVLSAGHIMLSFFKDMENAQKYQATFVEDLPSATLARILKYWIEVYPPAQWRVARKCGFNHLYNAQMGSYIASRIMSDFRAGEYWANELKRDFMRLRTFSQTRDGSMIEVGDEGHFPVIMDSPADQYYQMKADNVKWFTTDIERKFLTDYRQQAKYYIAHMAPGGYGHRTDSQDYFHMIRDILPISADDTWESTSNKMFIHALKFLSNGVMNEDQTKAILDYVFGQHADPRTLSYSRKDAQTMIMNYLGGVKQQEPTYKSDYLPYTGLHYLRGGWRYDEPFLHMMCQPDGGGTQLCGSDRWGGWPFTCWYDTEYTYWDYGVRLLVALPVKVDGKNQYRQYGRLGILPGSKTTRLTEAPEKPLMNRWLTTSNFDFTESYLDGAYQNVEFIVTKDSKNKKAGETFPPFGWPPAQECAKVEKDTPVFMHTQRQVIFLRKQRMFITTDRMQPKEEGSAHDYTMECILPLNAKEGGKPFSEDQLKIDEKALQLATFNPDTASVTASYFCSTPLDVYAQDSEKYAGKFGDTKRAPSQAGFGGTLTDRAAKNPKRIDFAERRAEMSWTAKGASAVVGVMGSRKTPDENLFADLKNCSTESGPAFSAKLANGDLFEYAAVNAGQAKLSSFGVDATAEALLVVQGKTGVCGIVLNASSFSISGKAVTLQTPDFEFDLSEKGELTFSPILYPIDIPKVYPERNVFVKDVMVELKSNTPDVEIHYTLDGTDPTPDSPLYTAPFKLTETTMVQSRAFRKGVKTVPYEYAGTRGSAVSYGFFKQQNYGRAPKVEQKDLEPGLDYEYIEPETWLQLFSFSDTLKPVATGKTNELMDVSMRKTDKVFGVRYEGYLNIPEATVYTFHAPKEFVRNIAEPGYDLRVWIDGNEWDLTTVWHGLGTWSIPLNKGPHALKVIFADAREKDVDHQRSTINMFYPTPWSVWRGTAPVIEISSGKLEQQPIPTAWLYHKK